MFDDTPSADLAQVQQYCQQLEDRLDRVATTIDLAVELIESETGIFHKDPTYLSMGLKVLEMQSQQIGDYLTLLN